MSQPYIKSKFNQQQLAPWQSQNQIIINHQPLLVKKNKAKFRQDKYLDPWIHKSYQNENHEEEAKKMLLDIQNQSKNIKLQNLKDYIDRRANMHLRRPNKEVEQSHGQFSFPKISSTKNQSISDTYTIQNSKKRQKQQNDIFKKYGEHRKLGELAKVQRSISVGNRMKQNNNFPLIASKYQTIDVQNYKQQHSQKHLELNGKKFRNLSVKMKKNTYGEAYTRIYPNITPYYLLFGHDESDILKKVLLQLKNKLK